MAFRLRYGAVIPLGSTAPNFAEQYLRELPVYRHFLHQLGI